MTAAADAEVAMPEVANDGTSAMGLPDQSQHHLGAGMVTVAV
jgi:hypothetical protein